MQEQPPLPGHGEERYRTKRSSAAFERPGQAGRPAVALPRDLVADVRPDVDPRALHAPSRLGVPVEGERDARTRAPARSAPSSRTPPPAPPPDRCRARGAAPSGGPAPTGGRRRRGPTSNGEMNDIRWRHSSGPCRCGRSKTTTSIDGPNEGAQLRDRPRRSSGSCARRGASNDPARRGPHPPRSPEPPAGPRSRSPSAVRSSATASGSARRPSLPGSQQDGAGVGHEDRVVRVDRVGVVLDPRRTRSRRRLRRARAPRGTPRARPRREGVRLRTSTRTPPTRGGPRGRARERRRVAAARSGPGSTT